MDKKFENYLHETRGEFVKAVNELQWNTGFRTKCENLLIAFDQMKQALRQPLISGRSEQFGCYGCKHFNNCGIRMDYGNDGCDDKE